MLKRKNRAFQPCLEQLLRPILSTVLYMSPRLAMGAYEPVTRKLLRHWSNYNGGQQIVRCDFRKGILLNYIRLIIDRYNLFIIISTFTEVLFVGAIDT